MNLSKETLELIKAHSNNFAHNKDCYDAIIIALTNPAILKSAGLTSVNKGSNEVCVMCGKKEDSRGGLCFDCAEADMNYGVEPSSQSVGVQSVSEEYKEICREITRLQEKYDENGYDSSPMIKLQRIEQHVDSTLKIYSKLLITLSDEELEKEAETEYPFDEEKELTHMYNYIQANRQQAHIKARKMGCNEWVSVEDVRKKVETAMFWLEQYMQTANATVDGIAHYLNLYHPLPNPPKTNPNE